MVKYENNDTFNYFVSDLLTSVLHCSQIEINYNVSHSGLPVSARMCYVYALSCSCGQVFE